MSIAFRNMSLLKKAGVMALFALTSLLLVFLISTGAKAGTFTDTNNGNVYNNDNLNDETLIINSSGTMNLVESSAGTFYSGGSQITPTLNMIDRIIVNASGVTLSINDQFSQVSSTTKSITVTTGSSFYLRTKGAIELNYIQAGSSSVEISSFDGNSSTITLKGSPENTHNGITARNLTINDKIELKASGLPSVATGHANGIYVESKLTLNNATVTAEGAAQGTAVASQTSTKHGNGVYAGSIDIINGGKLTGSIVGYNSNVSTGDDSRNGVYAVGNIDIRSGDITGTGGREALGGSRAGNGVYAGGSINLNSGTIKGTGGNEAIGGNQAGNGVYAGGTITLTSGSTTSITGIGGANGSGGTGSANGVYAGGAVTNNGDCEVTGTGGDNYTNGSRSGNGVVMGSFDNHSASIIGKAGTGGSNADTASGNGNGVYAFGSAASSNIGTNGSINGEGSGGHTSSISGNGIYITGTLGNIEQVSFIGKGGSNTKGYNSGNGFFCNGGQSSGAGFGGGGSIEGYAGAGTHEGNFSGNGVYLGSLASTVSGIIKGYSTNDNGSAIVTKATGSQSANGIYIRSGNVELKNGAAFTGYGGEGNQGGLPATEQVGNGIYMGGELKLTAVDDSSSRCKIEAIAIGNHNGGRSANGIYATSLLSVEGNATNTITATGGNYVTNASSGAGLYVFSSVDVYISNQLKIQGGTDNNMASPTSVSPAIAFEKTNPVSNDEWNKWSSGSPVNVIEAKRVGPAQVDFVMTYPPALENNYEIRLDIKKGTSVIAADAPDLPAYIGPAHDANNTSGAIYTRKTKMTEDTAVDAAPIINLGSYLKMRIRYAQENIEPENFYLKTLGISPGSINFDGERAIPNAMPPTYTTSVSSSTESITIDPTQWFTESTGKEFFTIYNVTNPTDVRNQDSNLTFTLPQTNNTFLITVRDSAADISTTSKQAYMLTVNRAAVVETSKIFTTETTENSITLEAMMSGVATADLSFQWYRVPTDGSPPIPIGTKKTGANEGTKFVDTGRTPGTTYLYKVEVTKESDSTFVPITVPSVGAHSATTEKSLAISRITATPKSGTEITVNAVIEGTKSGQDYIYQFSRSTSANGPWTEVGGKKYNDGTLEDHGLQPNTEYFYKCTVTESPSGKAVSSDSGGTGGAVSAKTSDGTGTPSTGAPSISTSSDKLNVEQGSTGSHTFGISGTTPISWSLTGTVPSGVTIDQTGKVSVASSTPVGIYSMTVKAANSVGADTKNFTVEVYAKGTQPSTPTPTPAGQTPTPTPAGQTPTPTPVGQTPTPTPSTSPGVLNADSITISGTPSNNTMYVGDKMTLVPTLASGFTKATSKWEYDTTYLTLSASGDTATFTAKKAGTTSVLYTVTDTAGNTATKTINVTILPKAGLPQTGYDDRWPTVMLWAGAILLLMVPLFGKGRRLSLGKGSKGE